MIQNSVMSWDLCTHDLWTSAFPSEFSVCWFQTNFSYLMSNLTLEVDNAMSTQLLHSGAFHNETSIWRSYISSFCTGCFRITDNYFNYYINNSNFFIKLDYFFSKYNISQLKSFAGLFCRSNFLVRTL